MRVLVSGVGSVLAPFLAPGHDVVGYDKQPHRCDFVEDLSSTSGRVADLRDVTPADLDGFDAVVHDAALSNERRAGRAGPDAAAHGTSSTLRRSRPSAKH